MVPTLPQDLPSHDRSSITVIGCGPLTIEILSLGSSQILVGRLTPDGCIQIDGEEILKDRWMAVPHQTQTATIHGAWLALRGCGMVSISGTQPLLVFPTDETHDANATPLYIHTGGLGLPDAVMVMSPTT